MANSYIKMRCRERVFIRYEQGFSSLEACLVIVLISFVIYLGYSHNLYRIKQADYSFVKFQAKTFERHISVISAQKSLAHSGYVKAGDENKVRVYLNEFGFPANTTSSSSPKSFNQTPEECWQLWNLIFKNYNSSSLGYKKIENKNEFKIFSINGHICRYEWRRKQEGRFFFDYDLTTGHVVVTEL